MSEGQSVLEFRDDEDGYEAWLQAHPRGLVFNHFGGSDGGYNLLHVASCIHLHRESDAGRRTQVRKLCSEDRGAITQAIETARAGQAWRRCGSCGG